MPLNRLLFLIAIPFLLQVPASSVQQPDILLITIDTLRADHLSCYGYKTGTSPNLDQLASQGWRFENAYSAVPVTLPSHATILTGVYPATHGYHDNAYFPPSATPLISEILKKQRYYTAAFVSGAPLSGSFGLDRGFDYYDDEFPGRERIAKETTERALQWLKSASHPFFLWVHYYDPHAEYNPPEPFRSDYSTAPYDGEIAYVDSQIAKLFHAIGSEDLVIVTADHGEGLGEHGESTHAVFLYNSTLHVPLILRGPNMAPKVLSEAVTLCDIVPTIIDITKISTQQRFDGTSLLAKQANRTLLAESLYGQRNFGYAPIFAGIQEQKKFILAPAAEFYDLHSDPQEKINLFPKTKPAKWEKSAREYANQVSKNPTRNEPLPPEQLEKLRSLGYISATSTPTGADPKSKIHVIEKLNAGTILLYTQQYAAAESQFKDLLKIDSGCRGFRSTGESIQQAPAALTSRSGA
jgi:arylsulfatase A-like enzyme